MDYKPLDPEDQEKLNNLSDEDYLEARRRVYDNFRRLLQRPALRKVDPLPEGFHGRWNELSLEDCKFLFACGIEID